MKQHPIVTSSMSMVVLVGLLSSQGGVLANSFRGSLFTPLKNDEHPCVAENLKESHRYLCDDDANVICLSGWREQEDEQLQDLRNPCPIPVCDYNGETCLHGECVRPNVCACKVGWEGHLCDTCIPLPGCVHGSCNSSFECNCAANAKGVQLWEGAFCDKPACANCDARHGQCFEPLVCTCHDGWEGDECKTCIKLPGCLNGDCEDGRPNTCQCHDGWTGHLCDEPICSEGCHEHNGYCEEPFTCLCKTGWEGDLCGQCVPYWQCPTAGTCVEPNQCICAESVEDNGYCNRDIINGDRYEDFGACSNPCRQNSAVAISKAGTRTRKCRWSPDGPCQDIEEPCYGNHTWILSTSSRSNAQRCIYNPGNGDEIFEQEAEEVTQAETAEGNP
ncbi:neurogenic locus protein delta-like [Tigriopus californicus]|uniref:neurogenic locus protein delta-like n=1 Tax=Tigriopus californicus TaxID=6832 RepID=UPI0027DA8BE2|nr:neurogenic locus protein delta-like [Tigriopus californicus]